MLLDLPTDATTSSNIRLMELLSGDLLSEILKQLPLASFIDGISVCRAWHAVALPLLRDHGQTGIWFTVCKHLNPAVANMRGVLSYWRLYRRLQPPHPAMREFAVKLRLEDLQFMIEIHRHAFNDAAALDASTRLHSLSLDGAGAQCYGPGETPWITPTSAVSHPGAQLGAWRWVVKGLLCNLGWASLEDGQAAANRRFDREEREGDDESEGESEHEGEELDTYITLSIFHGPTQRILTLSPPDNPNELKGRDPSVRPLPLRSVQYGPFVVPSWGPGHPRTSSVAMKVLLMQPCAGQCVLALDIVESAQDEILGVSSYNGNTVKLEDAFNALQLAEGWEEL